MRAIIMALALVATPAAAAEQFDLVCKGIARINGKSRSDEARFRVDLDQGKWCRDACTAIDKIQAIEPGRLLFRAHEPQSTADARYYQTVDRVTGAWADYFYQPGRYGSTADTRGNCEKAPFSGFPATKF